MTRDELIERVKEFLVEEFEVDGETIKPDAPLQETLDLDSLDYVDLVVVIEQNFGFKVVGEDFVDIKTFDDFYDYAYGKVQELEANGGLDAAVNNADKASDSASDESAEEEKAEEAEATE